MNSQTIKCSNCWQELTLNQEDEMSKDLSCPLCKQSFPNPIYVRRKREHQKGLNRIFSLGGIVLGAIVLIWMLHRHIPSNVEKIGTNGVSEQNTSSFGDNCINGWTGGCKAIEKYLRDNLDDPDSYENIETKFWDMNGYEVVVTKYRSRNQYGAKSISTIKAKVSYNCKLIEIIEIYP